MLFGVHLGVQGFSVLSVYLDKSEPELPPGLIVVDFGLGRDLTSTTQTVPDQVAGTDVYFDKYTCRTATSDIYKIVVP